MQILFVDESGTAPSLSNSADSPFFVLGGVIIPEEFWHQVKIDLEAIKKNFAIDGEVKWRYFAPQNKGAKVHSLSHLTAEEKEIVRSNIFAILQKYKSIKTICVITDTTKAYSFSYIKTSYQFTD